MHQGGRAAGRPSVLPNGNPKLVVEVRYDHISGDRFRHGTKLVRWRPDKAPRQCILEQLDSPR